VLVSTIPPCISHCASISHTASIRPTCLYKPSIYNNQVYIHRLLMKWFPAFRKTVIISVYTSIHDRTRSIILTILLIVCCLLLINLYFIFIPFLILVSEEDHTDADCISVTVLSHGIENGHIYARDALYRVETLWNPFNAENCPSLAGKPKLFFVQVKFIMDLFGFRTYLPGIE